MIEHNEMVVTLRDVAERLDELQMHYMVTGSFAMSVYTTARTTMDIDMILEIRSADAERFEKKFLNDYYVDASSIRRANEKQSMFNIISNFTGVKVDCIVKKPDRFEREKFERRWRSKIGGTEFWVIAKEDLILSKLNWAKDSHSELQFRDIRGLLESGADEEFLYASISHMNLSEAWKAFEKMEDTSREIRALQQAYWMTLSEEERFRRCGEMFALAKRFVEARVPAGLTEEQKRRFVFRELYGFDLPQHVSE